MNVPTMIAGAIVILVIGFVFFYEIRSRKKGKSTCSCGGSCAGCSMSGSCHPQK